MRFSFSGDPRYSEQPFLFWKKIQKISSVLISIKKLRDTRNKNIKYRKGKTYKQRYMTYSQDGCFQNEHEEMNVVPKKYKIQEK